MGRELFGTDGIRGVAGAYPLDPQTVHAVGSALGDWCQHQAQNPCVLIGMDTRESGPWIAAQVAGGLARHGVKSGLAGVISTPGIAHLTRAGDFVAGVMISASHNPFQDNGIKIFGHSGYKLPDAEEERLEAVIFAEIAARIEPIEQVNEVEPNLDEVYLDSLVKQFRGSLAGMKIVNDCGNGAAWQLAPAAMERLGAIVVTTGCQPNGRNINLDCGALHVDGLKARVLDAGADCGFAFDGDADRCIAVAGNGRIVDGDAILLLCARHLKAQERLPGSVVVATVMSNLGLQRALAADGIELVRTAVGDKYVLQEMLRRKAVLGGEQSGHVIFTDSATTGDGLLTALRTLEVMTSTGRPLADLVADLEVYPQKLLNVRVKERRPIEDLLAVCEAIRAAEQALGDRGRVLVRFSGTEPLARVMVEGPTDEAVSSHASSIADAIRSELGG
jgi:phosphoglucosamine mutase